MSDPVTDAQRPLPAQRGEWNDSGRSNIAQTILAASARGKAAGSALGAKLGASESGFRQDARFARSDRAAQTSSSTSPEAEAEIHAKDPVAAAYAEGYAAGVGQAKADAAEQARIDAEARAGLELAFAKLDDTLSEELRRRLRDIVSALCESAIAPLALDEDALMRRITQAVSMLSRADDDRVIRLNPDDMALVSDKLCRDWQVAADPSLERGELRVESTNGGVEDGPSGWRRSIAEALRQC